MATILFDLDGTLVDTAPDLLAVTNAILREKGIAPVPDDAIGHLVGQGGRAMLARAFEEQGQALDEDRLDTLVPRFIELYRETIPGRSRPFDGVVETLDTLRRDGHVCAICTNKFEDLSVALLEALDMADRFAVIAGPDTFDVRKPDPAHVLRTIEAVGGTPEASVMVGDSHNDIEAARRANVPSVAVTFGYTDVPAAELGANRVIDRYDASTAGLLAELATRRE